jgi:hypothetical protein
MYVFEVQGRCEFMFVWMHHVPFMIGTLEVHRRRIGLAIQFCRLKVCF